MPVPTDETPIPQCDYFMLVQVFLRPEFLCERFPQDGGTTSGFSIRV
jgi:hypothetical protein